ncbi:hypothetical protein P4604_01855 [Lysinibacillus capsici]|uniref:hypothetical protein n=1 Tax=Lysinibacillus capsici TaxID=2115968 RepID=UPI002E1BACA7|nr:hypothetical protein [Lysinibacillus capsici]
MNDLKNKLYNDFQVILIQNDNNLSTLQFNNVHLSPVFIEKLNQLELESIKIEAEMFAKSEHFSVTHNKIKNLSLLTKNPITIHIQAVEPLIYFFVHIIFKRNKSITTDN